MLAKICRLLQGKSDLTFDEQTVKILFEQGLHSFRQVPGDLSFETLDLAENGQRPVVKDRVRV